MEYATLKYYSSRFLSNKISQCCNTRHQDIRYHSYFVAILPDICLTSHFIVTIRSCFDIDIASTLFWRSLPKMTQDNASLLQRICRTFCHKMELMLVDINLDSVDSYPSWYPTKWLIHFNAPNETKFADKHMIFIQKRAKIV